MKGTELGKATGFCAKSANIWQVVGWILTIFKIVIPIILIVLGMIDLGKAVVASKDDEIKKSMKSLMFRAIAAVAIFFVPTIVGLIMGIVSGFNNDTNGVEKDFNICRACLVNPSKGKCASAATSANNADAQ
ncbi:MAG: hypothetical protein E7158_03265 [Firmicutes bacterium]|nr:hypothetical protein [Bacillota bacterium]